MGVQQPVPAAPSTATPGEPPAPSTAAAGDGVRVKREGCKKTMRFVLASVGRHSLAILASAGLAAGIVWYFSDPAFSNFSCEMPDSGKASATLQVNKGAQKGL